jgi:hypothetical protein
LSESDFLRGEIHTKWLDELLRRPGSVSASSSTEEAHQNAAADAAAIAAAIWQANQSGGPSSSTSSSVDQPSRWKHEGRRGQLDREP